MKRVLLVLAGAFVGWLVGRVLARFAFMLLYPGALGALTLALDPGARAFMTLLSAALTLGGIAAGVVVAVRRTRP